MIHICKNYDRTSPGSRFINKYEKGQLNFWSWVVTISSRSKIFTAYDKNLNGN